MKKQQLAVNADGKVKEIPVEIWRDYVRETHALRSGERVRRFFEPIDGGVADAATRICIGHWLDFESLTDLRGFRVDFSVLREPVNLRGLAVYLRLIDLLDFAEDRTPYVIWKFVAPRDPKSKIEWAKHRSLHPVTCNSYQAGRSILVDGRTENHEVYAALEDLRIYCEKQLRGCSDILARMNDPRHKLDLYHIDWRVAAIGFKPVAIQFEFERDRMFEILSDEIYQGDPYVFLRELLQNSIDAIRMRRAVLQRQGIEPGNLGTIRVTVEHGTAADAIVTWQDDGIGMDEYVVRKYLAVAGKSYYASEDFEREGLKLDPISRFGIGMLSCFMVARRIEIETFKDPYFPPEGEPLNIIIPDPTKQFRIEPKPREGTMPGTTVRVFVDGNRLPKRDDEKPASPLDVTGYLCVVAGFVEFPIVIHEGDRKTVILHPKHDAAAARERFGTEYQVRQLDPGYAWSDVILAQDLRIAREVFAEKQWDLALDLGLKDCEGVLSYLVPDPGADAVRTYLSLEMTRECVAIRLVERGKIENVRGTVRWPHPFLSREREGDHLSRSSKFDPLCSVYRDGILLAAAGVDRLANYMHESMPPQRIVVNLTKSKEDKIDLARTQILRRSQHWIVPIKEGVLREAYAKANLVALEPTERFYQMGRFIEFNQVDPRSLWEIFPHGKWPLLFLRAGGQLTVLEWEAISSESIALAPEPLEEDLAKMCIGKFLARVRHDSRLQQWQGEPCLISNLGVWPDLSESIKTAVDLWRFPLEVTHRFGGVRFLRPLWSGGAPLPQQIWVPTVVPANAPELALLLEMAAHDPTLLGPFEMDQLKSAQTIRWGHIPEFAEFHGHYHHQFAYYWQFVNIRHPVGQTLFQLLARVELSKIRHILTREQCGQMRDVLGSIYDWYTTRPVEWERWARNLKRVWRLAADLGLLDSGSSDDLIPTREEFVPGTAVGEKGRRAGPKVNFSGSPGEVLT